MPDVLKFPPQDVSWEHGQVGVFALQGLHAGQLIYADRAFSLPGSRVRLCVDQAAIDDLLFPLRVFLLG